MFNFKIVSLLGLASTAAAHFFLQLPETIGFDDSTMEEGPCGGFDPTLRDGPITDWPVNGHPVSLVTTHQSVVWHVEAALLSDPTNFVPIAVPFQQTGVGEVCFESVPGKASWVGEQVIISIYQVTNHGDLYQCIAARFTEGPAADVPGSCTSFDGVEFDPIVAAPDDGEGTATTTVADTTTTAATSGMEDSSTADGTVVTDTSTPAPTSDDDDGDDGHDHSTEAEPTSTGTSGHDHGDDHGHGTATPSATDSPDHGHETTSVVDGPTPTNGTVLEPTETLVEAGAAIMGMSGIVYIGAAGAALAML